MLIPQESDNLSTLGSKWCNQVFLHKDTMGTWVKVISGIPENRGACYLTMLSKYTQRLN